MPITRRSIVTIISLAAFLSLRGYARALELTPADSGIAVRSSAGELTMQYPVLINDKSQEVHKLVEKKITGNSVLLTYQDNVSITLTIQQGENITLTPVGMPADVRQMRIGTLIDFSLATGGTWQFDQKDAKPFPATKPATPHIFSDHAATFAIKTQASQSLSFVAPPYTFHQLTDNREWNWKIFQWTMYVSALPDSSSYTIVVKDGGQSTGPVKKLVDMFGQTAQADFPEKIKSLEELKADVEKEKSYYASFHPPVRDRFGGLPDSGSRLGLEKTGYFHVEQMAGRWYLVDPDGNAYFHLSVGCLPPEQWTYTEGRENVFEWLPKYPSEFAACFQPQDKTSFDYYTANYMRKYGMKFDRMEMIHRTIDRLRGWGFNSGGPFSSADMARQKPGTHFPYVLLLPMEAWRGIKMIPGAREAFDPFDQATTAQIRRFMATEVTPHANDPLLIGSFLINEPAYEDLPKVIPSLDQTWPCKRRLVQMLKDQYQTIEKFNQAWKTDFASFDVMNQRGLPVATQQAYDDMNHFVELFLETYYQFVRDAYRTYDQKHMLLGNRLQAGTINNQMLCRIAGKYIDVMSFNYYTYALDKNFLARIHQWSGRPLILSEFYYNSTNDSGLAGGIKDVNSQRERGLGYRQYVEQAAALDYVIGTEWFMLADQPTLGMWFGKYSGENGNTGLLSVVDRPWKEMIAEMVKTNYDIYKVMTGERAPFVLEDPRFSTGATAKRTLRIHHLPESVRVDGSVEGWPNVPAETIPGSRLVQGASGSNLEAAAKVGWNSQNLYLLITVADGTPMQNRNDDAGMLWSGDAVELFIGAENLEQGGPLLFNDRQIIISAAPAHTNQPHVFISNTKGALTCPLTVIRSTDGKGYTLAGAIPWTAIGFTPKAGQEIRFDLGVDDSEDGTRRLRQLMWNGTATNSTDRTGWGSAILTP